MGTVVFDFDSTLIQCESLEEILAPKCAAQPGLEDQIRAITAEGMEGKITFQESLAKRLALAAPSRQEVVSFGESAKNLLTPGIEDLVKDLRAKGHSVRIISGGLREAIVPVALYLGLDADDVGAVSLSFDDNGQFVGIDENDLYSDSKLAGARPICATWPKTVVAVGDGMTDYHLYQYGLVDHFIAYTQWVRREPVLAMNVPEAQGVGALSKLLEELL